MEHIFGLRLPFSSFHFEKIRRDTLKTDKAVT